jgi:hypothetical protein
MIFFLFKIFAVKKMMSKKKKKKGAGGGGCLSCIFGGEEVKEPTSLLDAAETTSGEEAAGWLTKKGAQRKNFKKRWFVVKDGTISYYTDKGGERKGGFDLDGVKVRIDKGAENANTFRISPQDGSRVYEVYAESPKQMHLWIKKIEDVAQALKEGRHGTLDEAGVSPGDSVQNPLSEAPRKQSLLGSLMGVSTGQSLGKDTTEVDEEREQIDEAAQEARKMVGYLYKKGKGEVSSTFVLLVLCLTASCRTTYHAPPTHHPLVTHPSPIPHTLSQSVMGRRNWKKRWFVLEATEIIYYADEMSAHANRKKLRSKGQVSRLHVLHVLRLAR